MIHAPDESNSPSLQNNPSAADRLGTSVYNRETSTASGRIVDPPSASSARQFQHPRRKQSRSKSPDGRKPSNHDEGVERRPSNSYGHHRKTSIVHGVQHSRNASFANWTATSTPLNPELITSAGRAGVLESDDDGIGKSGHPDGHLNHLDNPSTGGAIRSMSETLREKLSHVDTGASAASTNHLHKRANSSVVKPWREHSHSRSHSLNSADTKSVGEYALHHLFNSVRRCSRDYTWCNSADFSQVRWSSRCQNEPSHSKTESVGVPCRGCVWPRG